MDPFWLGVLVTLAIEGGLFVGGGLFCFGFFLVMVRLG
jgi:hypothetical protein